MPVAGAPIGPDIESPERAIVFDHVPQLHELLPNGGWPGVVYAQVCAHNVVAANNRVDRPANLRPIKGAAYYAIRGSRGMAEMALVGTGSPIPGAAPEAGARLFFTDGEVERLTGHSVPAPIWLRPQPAEPRPRPPEPEPAEDWPLAAQDARKAAQKKAASERMKAWHAKRKAEKEAANVAR